MYAAFMEELDRQESNICSDHTVILKNDTTSYLLRFSIRWFQKRRTKYHSKTEIEMSTQETKIVTLIINYLYVLR